MTDYKKMDNKRITIADVAEAANVSTATVSRVINNLDNVTEETAARVRATIERIGYTPQAAARNLASRRTRTIGVLLREIGNDFAAQIIHGIEASTFNYNYNLLIASQHFDENGKRLSLPLGPHNTDGLIAFTGVLSKQDIIQLHQLGFPLLLLYEPPPRNLSIPSIQIENRLGTRKLIDHLIEVHGYQKFAFLQGPENNLDTQEREQGLRESLQSHGLSLDPELVGFGDFSEKVSQQVVHQWVEEGRQIDVIFGGSDEGAVGAMIALQNMGIRVPEDIAVVGFDDMNHVRYLSPPLTTVHAPTEKIGMLAVDTIMRIIKGESVDGRKIMPTELVIRRSCGCQRPIE